MQPFLRVIILLVFLQSVYFANAQVKFSASISPAEIGRDEYAQLKLMVENANEVQQIVPPNLRDFIIISGPNQENGMTMINGVVKKYIALSFILKPKSTGNFIILPAKAKADAGDYTSNPVKLKVTAQTSGKTPPASGLNTPFGGLDPFVEPAPRSSFSEYILRKGENSVEKIKKNIFVRVEVDKKTTFIGEPVVATYKLYTRLKSESNMTKNPSFNGFSVLDIQQPNDLSYVTEKYEGRDYNVYTIRKVQLYPLLAGNLELGIAEIENKVQFIKEDYLNQYRDMFNDFSDATIPPEGIYIEKVALQSKPLSVLVKPLPDAGKPAGFKGAVGNFSIETKIEKNNLSTDDDGKMAIIISGEGNLQMVNAPEIAWPDGFEGFDPKATDDLYKGTIPVSGRKIFEFPFTVSKPGKFYIPAIAFSFFDTRDASYKTVLSKPVEITITKGTGKPSALNIETGNKKGGNYLSKFFNNRLRVVSLIAVFIIIGLIIWLKKDTKKEKKVISDAQAYEEKTENEKSHEVILSQPQNPLTLTEESLQRNEAGLFYKQLNQDLKNYLSKKLALPAEELNRKNIAEQLDAMGISNETAVSLQHLIDEIEWQLYTPFADTEKMKEMYERANELIQLVHNYPNQA
jgi:hypothetical protein